MSEGNKRCMYFIAQTYDISDLKRLKQLAYRDLLMRQQYLGELDVHVAMCMRMTTYTPACQCQFGLL